MDPFVSNQISRIQRVKNSSLMNEKLRSRPNIDVLIEKNILPDYDINLVGTNNNKGSDNNQQHQPFNTMNNSDIIGVQQTNNPLSTYTTSNKYLLQNNSSKISNGSNANNAGNRNNRNSGVILDPFEKQKIQYMLSDHLVTRPSPIDLLNCQILCPDLQYSDHLKNLNGNSLLNSIHSYFDEFSKMKQKQTDFQKKTKKYSFHDVTPDKIKLSNSNNISTYSKGFRGVNCKVPAAVNNNSLTSPNNQDLFRSHHKRLIEQQTIYLNYEVARRNALISQLKKEKDELFNIKYMLECHNLNQNSNNSCINTNSIHDMDDTLVNKNGFNDHTIKSNFPLDFHQSTPIGNTNNENDNIFNDASTLNSDPMFNYRPSNICKNLMHSSEYSVDDYLRKFDIDIPSQRRLTDSYVDSNSGNYSVSRPLPHYIYNENQHGPCATPPSYSNFAFTNGANNPICRNFSLNQFGNNPINSVSDVTFENRYNYSTNVDSSYSNSNTSDIFNNANHVYSVNNGFSTARNSNDFQHQQFPMGNYDTSQDHSSLGVAQMDFNSLVAFYELLADMSRNSKH